MPSTIFRSSCLIFLPEGKVIFSVLPAFLGSSLTGALALGSSLAGASGAGAAATGSALGAAAFLAVPFPLVGPGFLLPDQME
jgi:hypothetical protein